MAKFDLADSKTQQSEGGYANNKADSGGRTINGISYNNWPKWKGWPRVMAIIEKVGENAKLINAEVRKDQALLDDIKEFYKVNFWDVLNISLIADQQLAEAVFDFGVNSGTGRAAKFLQQAANDTGLVVLTVDGSIGAKTIAAINALSPLNVYTNFNRRREAFYRSIAVGSQKQFLASWLSRLTPYKTCV